MSSATVDVMRPDKPSITAASRIRAAVRAQLISPATTFGWPWGVLSTVFVINLLIFSVISDVDRADAGTGALISIYIVVLIGAAQAVTQYLPFCVGLSLTRRTCFTAACLIQAGQAVVFGVTLWLGLLAERATDGWGVGMRLLGPDLVLVDPAIGQVAAYIGPFLLCSAIGMFWGAVQVRWGMTGIYVATIMIIAGVGALIALIAVTDSWPAVGDLLAGSSTVALLAGWPPPAAVVIAAAGYAVLRRATP